MDAGLALTCIYCHVNGHWSDHSSGLITVQMDTSLLIHLSWSLCVDIGLAIHPGWVCEWTLVCLLLWVDYYVNGQWYTWTLIWVDYCVNEHCSDHNSGCIIVQKVTTCELDCHSWRVLYTQSQCLCLTSQVLRFHCILLPSFWNTAHFWNIVCFLVLVIHNSSFNDVKEMWIFRVNIIQSFH